MEINYKTVAIVSGIAEELNASNNEYDYSIGKLKSCKLFDNIVIASPNIETSIEIEQLAKSWEVDYYAGPGNNVLQRFKDVINIFKPNIICRVQLRACWVDIGLVSQALDLIRQGFDYIDYGLDINYAMGADIFTSECFLKAEKIINGMDECLDKNTFQFSPWALMQDNTVFNIGTVETVELYSKHEVKRLRKKLDTLFGLEQNMLAVNPSDPGIRYRKVQTYIDKKDIVLDIACGKGGGTSYLSNYCSMIYGIDSDLRYIEYAKMNYGNNSVSFIHGTDKNIKKLNIYFDKIVSLHTIEHVNDDGKFLVYLNKYLKPDGLLILEVPRLLKYPLGEPLWPFHEREYSVNEIRKLLHKTGFEIVEEKGGNRNRYVGVKYAREVLFFVARKRRGNKK